MLAQTLYLGFVGVFVAVVVLGHLLLLIAVWPERWKRVRKLTLPATEEAPSPAVPPPPKLAA